jgi:hypothetical protein
MTTIDGLPKDNAQSQPVVAAAELLFDPKNRLSSEEQLSGESEIRRSTMPAAQSDQSEPPGLLSDCRLMLRYARANAFVLTPELMHQIAWLDAVLKLNSISPISALTPALVGEVSPEAAAKGYVARSSPAAVPAAPGAGAAAVLGAVTPDSVALSAEEMVLKVHSDLSLLIAPTTALSLQSSEPPPGSVPTFGGMPRLVKTATVIAVVSALAFVISAVNVKSADEARSPTIAASDPSPTEDKRSPVQQAKEPASAVVSTYVAASKPAATPSGVAMTTKATASAPIPAIIGEKK